MSVQSSIVTALNSVLPNAVYYELDNTPKTIPCITYIGSGDRDTEVPGTVNYGTTKYTIKVWGTDYSNVITNHEAALEALRPLGFIVEGGNETTHDNLICKIINIQARVQFGSDAWIE